MRAQGWCDSGITASALTQLLEALIAIGDSTLINFSSCRGKKKVSKNIHTVTRTATKETQRIKTIFISIGKFLIICFSSPLHVLQY